MEVPHGRARLIVINLIADLLRNAHRNYYAELTFAEAVAAQIISGEIIAAELHGKPLSAQRLAEIVQVPRRTIARRLDQMTRKGFIRREPDGLHFNSALYQDHSIQNAVALIRAAAEALSESE